MLTLTFGDAIALDGPDDPIIGNPRVRTYIVGELAFLGSDTDDLAYVCDEQCAADLIRRDFASYVQCEDSDTYVDPSEQTDTAGSPVGKWSTIDVGDGDTGDDTYVLCAYCESELVREDLAHFESFGNLIRQPSPEWSGDDKRIWSGLVAADDSGEMIDAGTAHIIASQWHGGQSSALYSFTSTGRVFDTTAEDLLSELDEEISGLTRRSDSDEGREIIALRALRAFIVGTFPSYFAGMEI